MRNQIRLIKESLPVPVMAFYPGTNGYDSNLAPRNRSTPEASVMQRVLICTLV